MDAVDQTTPMTLCLTENCPLRMSCERANRISTDVDQDYRAFLFNDDRTCDWFVLRAALKDESKVFRKQTGPQKHNRHAPIGDRDRTNRKLAEKLLGGPPDLNVKRHIRMGHDINKEPS
jgi:hypothetical protein